jgi:hypothetical protein
MSTGLIVLEYTDGSGEVDRVGAGEAAEARVEPTTELGLRGGGGGIEVSGVAVCDTVLERPREKISPGRDGREEEEEEEEEGVADTVVCDCVLDTTKNVCVQKSAKSVLTVKRWTIVGYLKKFCPCRL